MVVSIKHLFFVLFVLLGRNAALLIRAKDQVEQQLKAESDGVGNEYSPTAFLVDSLENADQYDDEGDEISISGYEPIQVISEEQSSKIGANGKSKDSKSDGDDGVSEWLNFFNGPDSSWEYPYPKDDGLQQIVGFSYCKQLNLAVFDVDAPMNALIVEAILELEDSENERSKNGGLLRQLVMHKKLARMFSPTIDPDSLPKFMKSTDKGKSSILNDTFTPDGDKDDPTSSIPKITIRQLGHQNFVKLIDAVAELLFHAVVSKYKLMPLEKNNIFDSFIRSPVDSNAEAKRFSCFMAADGHNDWVQLTIVKQKLLRFVEGRLYFDNEIRYQWLDMGLVQKEARQMHRQWAQCREGCKPVENEPEQQPLSTVSADKLSDYFGFRKFITAIKNNKKGAESEQDYVKVSPVSPHEVKPHKLAYFLLVHKDYDNVVSLLESIVDPYVTILIHVDGKSPSLKKQLLELLSKKAQEDENYKRVRIMKRSFCGVWGHSTLVFAQLAGFFELMSMNTEWEYVINLSGHDYPLRMNDVIYKDLKANGVTNYIEHWNSMDAIERVNDQPNLLSTSNIAGQPMDVDEDLDIYDILPEGDKTKQIPQEVLSEITQVLKTQKLGKLSFPFSHWPVYKHHQWMILHRSFVEHMRYSPTAIYLAAFMEFAVIPDESYFATLLRNSPIGPTNSGSNAAYGKSKITNDFKRFLVFLPGAIHPRWITETDLGVLVDAVERGKAFTRKINVGGKKGESLRKGIERIRAWDWNRTFDFCNQGLQSYETVSTMIVQLPTEIILEVFGHLDVASMAATIKAFPELGDIAINVIQNKLRVDMKQRWNMNALNVRFDVNAEHFWQGRLMPEYRAFHRAHSRKDPMWLSFDPLFDEGSLYIPNKRSKDGLSMRICGQLTNAAQAQHETLLEGSCWKISKFSVYDSDEESSLAVICKVSLRIDAVVKLLYGVKIDQCVENSLLQHSNANI